MPNWGEVEHQIANVPNPLDSIRRKYLNLMHQYTERNIIAYYSGFLQKAGVDETGINDNDKNAFMQVVHGLDRSKGLDLILHTPGGEIAATESLVYCLKQMFGNDIRAFIPQIAMSAGTMVALSCRCLVLGKQSNIGPIDPQFGGMSCAAVLEEFQKASAEVSSNPGLAYVWQPIIGKYHPTFLGDCEKAIVWSQEMVRQWLAENMLKDAPNRDTIAQGILDVLSSHNETKSHSRHIHIEECQRLGICAVPLEGLDVRPIGPCKDLQDCVLTIHHTYMQTFSKSNALKIVENHQENAMIMAISAN